MIIEINTKKLFLQYVKFLENVIISHAVRPSRYVLNMLQISTHSIILKEDNQINHSGVL